MNAGISITIPGCSGIWSCLPFRREPSGLASCILPQTLRRWHSGFWPPGTTMNVEIRTQKLFENSDSGLHQSSSHWGCGQGVGMVWAGCGQGVGDLGERNIYLNIFCVVGAGVISEWESCGRMRGSETCRWTRLITQSTIVSNKAAA